MSTNEENWKDIPGYEGLYQASSIGRIRSMDRYKDNHTKKQFIKGKILKIGDDTHGYNQVVLSKNGKVKTFKVHRLVAMTFLENTQNKKDINHKNGNRKDNRIENLEWCSRSYNLWHMYNVLGNSPRIAAPVQCIETGKKYRSCLEAEKDTGINNARINAAARHKVVTYPSGKQNIITKAGEFHWRLI